GAGGLDFIAYRDARPGAQRQVDIDARPEADESVTLSSIQPVAGLCVTKYTLGNQPCHLDGCHDMALGGCKDCGIALVFERCLVQRGVEKAAREITDGRHSAVDRSTV